MILLTAVVIIILWIVNYIDGEFMSGEKFTKDYECIADSILECVDYDIYKDDEYENDHELRDEIECTLRDEFEVMEEMYAFIESLQLDVTNDYKRDELLAKARGEDD